MDSHKRFRRAYYNLFSKIYDGFVAVHSGDKKKRLREWLVETASPKPGMRILDLCTGTGEVAALVKRKLGPGGLVVGVDFSEGMLEVAKGKCPDVEWIQADVVNLPFRDRTFDIAFCAYGFYELKDWQKLELLKEVRRVLRPKGRFFIMEHEEPDDPLIRFLYRVRLATMGSFDPKGFIAKEMQIISTVFKSVRKLKSSSGNSKIIIAGC